VARAQSPLVGFLRINRSVLAITATAFVFAAVGIHEMPAQAATQVVAKTVPGQHLEVSHESTGSASAAATSSGSASVSGSGSSSSSGSSTPAVLSPDAFTVESFSVVQWPIDPSSPISSPFGPRSAPCDGCSTMHRGVDFTPGLGTPIAAIADGVVTEVGNPSGELGVYAIVQHDIDGEIVSSVYGHMQSGSMHLKVGDTVHRGDIVGSVGDTGESTGPHLHFGILDAAGTPINPINWMTAHVNQTWRS
jgi:murein DD-endopeptidase MepM/ murein hydrolase activator NlpD